MPIFFGATFDESTNGDLPATNVDPWILGIPKSPGTTVRGTVHNPSVDQSTDGDIDQFWVSVPTDPAAVRAPNSPIPGDRIAWTLTFTGYSGYAFFVNNFSPSGNIVEQQDHDATDPFASHTITISGTFVMPAHDIEFDIEAYAPIRLDGSTLITTDPVFYTLTLVDTTDHTDNSPPQLISATPADDMSGVALNSNIVLNFNEAVKLGTGNIELRKFSDNSAIATQAIVSGSTVTIHPISNLTADTHYYLYVPQGAIEDIAGNDYSGFTNNSTLDFTTGAGARIVSITELPGSVVHVGSPGTTTASFLVQLGSAPTSPLTVGLFPNDSSHDDRVVDGVDTQLDSDWRLDTAALTFNPGQSLTQVVNVTVMSPPIAEPKTAYFTLGVRVAQSSGFTPDANHGSAVGTIINDASASTPRANVSFSIADTGLAPYTELLRLDFQAALNRVVNEIGKGKLDQINIKVDQATLPSDVLASTQRDTLVDVFAELYRALSPSADIATEDVKVSNSLLKYRLGVSKTNTDIHILLDPAQVKIWYSGEPDKAGSRDATTILTHELLHGFGFGQGYQLDVPEYAWETHLVTDDLGLQYYQLGADQILLTGNGKETGGNHVDKSGDFMSPTYIAADTFISFLDGRILQDFGYSNQAIIYRDAGNTDSSSAGSDLSDAIQFGSGNHSIQGGGGNDVIFPSAGAAGNNVLDGGIGDDSIVGGVGGDTIIGGPGVDRMRGGLGSDIYYVDNIADLVIERTGEGIDSVHANLNYVLPSNVENLFLDGAADLQGYGNELSNSLYGNSGGNFLDGGAGADNMFGGAGNDAYVVDNGGDLVVEYANEGTGDTVYASISYTLGANLELLVLQGSADLQGYGNGLGNTLYGNSGGNFLDGGAGADSMFGGAGNDAYAVDNVGDLVVENANEGTGDTVYASISYTLGANLELLVLQGSANLNGAGNALGNTLYGNIGGNFLDGGAGADSMFGGAGNDAYAVDNVGDLVVENANEGTGDTVYASISYTLGANLELLVLQGSANLNGAGNALGNTLYGNIGGNFLDGGAGADSMFGGAGNDAYAVDNVGDLVVENANEGTGDTVYASISYTLGANLELLVLQGGANLNGAGNALGNTLYGNIGGNFLDGGAGADSMFGGAGNDAYAVDNVGDVVIENANEGNDTVNASVSYTLGANVETLVLQGSADLQGYGNGQANTLYGNSGNNLLNGGGGADVMAGGTGNDAYFIDSSGDQVVENTIEGNDTVFSTVNSLLADNVETLVLQGSADLQGYGNGLANTLYGNSGNNLLNGGGGADVMAGGTGNEVYFIDNPGDQVVENANEGNDTVFSTVNSLLADNVETLVLQGSADLQGYGNGLANTLYGNSGNNPLNGGGGADVMAGGTGNEVYFIDNPGDQVVENVNEGNDTVFSTVNSLLADNVETLVLQGSADLQGYGNGLANTLYGNSGNNLLNGMGGADVMAGGTGNEVYFIDNPGDQVVENVNEGNDTVFSTVNSLLADNVETLVLQGSADLQGYGNGLANTLYGNSGNNLLNGMGGADVMAGGTGNEVYFIDNPGDQVVENANEGNDTVFSTVNSLLADNVETLVLQGSADLQGYGNGLANTLYGNSGNNLLNGGGGADVMAGGTGNEVYFIDNPGDQVVENANEGNDTVFSTVNSLLAANVENLVLQGSANLQGYGNSQANVLNGNSGNNLLNGGVGADLMVGGAGNDVYFVDDPSDSCFEVANEGNDAVFASCNYGLAADVETLVMQGSGDYQGYGGNQANTLNGNSGNNLLNGGGGADTMIGGAGGDVYFVENVGDVVFENANEGFDAVFTSVNYTLSANVETLVLQGAGNLSGTGNALANTLYGNTGANTLDGGAGADNLQGDLGNDIFVFRPGEANGDTLFDFAGNGAAVGDSLLFIGYGAGATLTHIGATNQWQVNYNGGSSHDIITFANSAPVDPTDFSFV